MNKISNKYFFKKRKALKTVLIIGSILSLMIINVIFLSAMDKTEKYIEVIPVDRDDNGIIDEYQYFSSYGHSILIEEDMNQDGTIDEIFYNDVEGNPIRHETDRNFDGDMDKWFYFERKGKPVKVEEDNNYDGTVDEITTDIEVITIPQTL